MDVVRVAGQGAKSRRRRGTWRSRSLQLHRSIQQLSFDHRPPPHLLARSLLYNLHLDLPNLQLSSSSPLALMPLPLLSGPPPRKSTDTCRRCSKKFNLFSNRARTCGHCGFSYCQEVSSDMLLYSGGIEEEMVNELEADDEPDSASSQHCDHRALTPRRPDSFSIRGGGGSGGSGYEEEHCCDFCISFVKSERKEEKENELNSRAHSSCFLFSFACSHVSRVRAARYPAHQGAQGIYLSLQHPRPVSFAHSPPTCLLRGHGFESFDETSADPLLFLSSQTGSSREERVREPRLPI